jgi:hypothetical protein
MNIPLSDTHEVATFRRGLVYGRVFRIDGVTEQTYDCWRREYGGINVDQAKSLKDLEKENARLKKLVAHLSFDKWMLHSVGLPKT